MINRKSFFLQVRVSLFDGKLSQSQVDGMTVILDEWESSGFTDTRWLAYMLATAYHETGRTMQPIEEWGKGKRRPYGSNNKQDGTKYTDTTNIFYGRGFVQITWYENYKKMGKILGIDLINNPELALDPKIAVKIMFEGMTTSKSLKGDFTNKHLGHYFNDKVDDPKNARRIINGLDKAELIRGYYNEFNKALNY
jgi:hypothetical protein